MALNFLQSRIEKTIKKVRSKGILSEENISDILNEIRLILLESDVNIKVVKKFISDIKEKSNGLIVDSDRTSSQELIKLINNEIIVLLGKNTYDWKSKQKEVIMMVGLQGSGKTTTSAKIANYLSKKQKKYKKPLLVSLDVYRPAAIDQLETLSKKIFVDFFSIRDEKNVEKILKKALKIANENDNDLIVLDTAGRLQTDEELMNELSMIKKVSKPTEIVYVVDGMAGQEVLNVIDEFNQKLKLSSIIVTKLDSNTKGGIVLSVSSYLNLPISFTGVGEKISNLEIFYPDRMASRILGLGDIKTLTEKVMETTDKNSQEKMMRKVLSGKFDLDDLMSSIEQMNKMGSLSSISKMLPGFKVSDKQTNFASEKMDSFKYLINSMTKKEKKNPKILKHPKRKKRIISGSGRTIQEFNELLRYYEKSQKQMKEFAKVIKSGKMPNMNSNFFG